MGAIPCLSVEFLAESTFSSPSRISGDCGTVKTAWILDCLPSGAVRKHESATDGHQGAFPQGVLRPEE